MWRKPVWTEGLFISQQHFQAQDRYHEGRLQRRVSTVQPFPWGVARLEIDLRLLSAGQFGLRALDAVWPDGLMVRCDGTAEGDPLPEPRAFEAHLKTGGTLDVLIGVPLEGTANVGTFADRSAAVRFERVAQSMEDYNSGGAPQDIDFAVPQLRIVFGDERHERLATLPIAQLLRQSDGKVALRDTFVPPVLHIGAAPFVTAGLRRVLGAMVARQRELTSTRKQRSAGSVEFHLADARRFWLLHTLNSAIPALSHFVENEQTSPEHAYLALATLVGELSTFAPDPASVVVPRFDFLRLGDVFEPLFARALGLLTVDSAPLYTEIPLQHRADGMFLGKLPDARSAHHEFFVAARSSVPESDVRERIPQLLKVADWKNIVDVVKQARHGVRVEVEWHPSAVLPLRPGVAFFRLRREGPFWDEIVRSNTLALCLPNEPMWKDAMLQVYAVDPEALR